MHIFLALALAILLLPVQNVHAERADGTGGGGSAYDANGSFSNEYSSWGQKSTDPLGVYSVTSQKSANTSTTKTSKNSSSKTKSVRNSKSVQPASQDVASPSAAPQPSASGRANTYSEIDCSRYATSSRLRSSCDAINRKQKDSYAVGTPVAADSSGAKGTYSYYNVGDRGRMAWRIHKKGPAFGPSLTVVFSNGYTVTVPNTSQRYAKADGFTFRPGIGSIYSGTGTSHNGIYIYAPFGNRSTSLTIK